LSESHSTVTGKRLTLPNRCSTAATIRSRTSSPEMPPVVARKLMAPRGHSSPTRKQPGPSLAVIAADLEAIRAPVSIAFIEREAAVVPPLDTVTLAIEQQAMDLQARPLRFSAIE
jgi:hypothetical protein